MRPKTAIPRAQYELALCYLNKKMPATEPQFSNAVSYLIPAAESGLAEAQYSLGVCYLHGVGLRYSPAEAEKWLSRAAAQGNEEARVQLAALRRKHRLF